MNQNDLHIGQKVRLWDDHIVTDTPAGWQAICPAIGKIIAFTDEFVEISFDDITDLAQVLSMKIPNHQLDTLTIEA